MILVSRVFNEYCVEVLVHWHLTRQLMMMLVRLRMLAKVISRIILKMILRRDVYLTFWDESLKMKISKVELDDDELLTAWSIELDRWFRSWANAKRQIKCRYERKNQNLIKRFDKIATMRFWMMITFLIWRIQLINVNLSLVSVRDVVWLRQCRLSWWDKLIIFSS
jgi:hypothetical protein